MNNRTKRPVMVVSLLAASFASAQDANEATLGGIRIAAQEEPSKNRFGLGYQMGFNMKAEFKGMGAFSAMTNPGPGTGGGLDRVYDDGYNRVDSSGNAGGITWYWGYDNASQLPGNDTLVMHSNSSGGTGDKGEETDDAAPGFQLTYARDFGAAGKGRWGLDSAFSFMDFQYEDHSPVTGDLFRLNDAYQLNGVTPPFSPYTGGFAGPSTVIGDNPTRTYSQIPDGALTTGARNLEVKYFGFRVGPYWEMPLSEKVDFTCSGGFSFAVVHGEFHYKESIFVPGMTIPSRSGSDTETDVLFGGYMAASLQCELNESTTAYTEIQFQHLGDYETKADGLTAKLKFGAATMVSVGLRYSF